MAKKTIEQTAKALKEIIAELSEGVIKDYTMPTLINMETTKNTGFAVVLTLSSKFDYSTKVLDEWRDRLSADYYVITVRRNQLIVRYIVLFNV